MVSLENSGEPCWISAESGYCKEYNEDCPQGASVDTERLRREIACTALDLLDEILAARNTSTREDIQVDSAMEGLNQAVDRAYTLMQEVVIPGAAKICLEDCISNGDVPYEIDESDRLNALQFGPLLLGKDIAVIALRYLSED